MDRSYTCNYCFQILPNRRALYAHIDSSDACRTRHNTRTIIRDRRTPAPFLDPTHYRVVHHYRQEYSYEQDYIPLSPTIEVPKKKLKDDIPNHVTNMIYDMSKKLGEIPSCPVCLNEVTKKNIRMSFCGHIFCSECLETIKQQNSPKCASCRSELFI